ncbi:MAG: helix-turn-helix domain-containing protein [Bacteroidales bacterium]|nr:helix-turn-helix domain-containing protein [Bacteroidales bacterium]
MKYTACFILLLSVVLLTNAQPKSTGLPALGKSGEEIACSLQDAEGYWWYGGKGTGLCRFDGYETESFRSDRQHPYLLQSNDVLCLTEQKNKAEIWFGTKEGAYILSKKDYTVRPITVGSETDGNELADKRVGFMLSAADGSVWLAFRNQLLHFSEAAELLERFETTWEGKNRSISSLRFDADSSLWAQLWNGGVVCLKSVDGKRTIVSGTWSDFPEDAPKGRSSDEIKQMLDSVMTQLAPPNDATVLSWALRKAPSATGEDTFYIGTYHSLYFYDGQYLRPLQRELDKVRSLAYSEKLQTLYLLSKARGVCQWKDDQLTILLDSLSFRQLQLQGDTALLLSQGVTGTSLLHLTTLQLSPDETVADVKPVATACLYDGTRQLIGFGQHSLTLPRGTDLVEVCLSTLTFRQASQVQFAYRMSVNGAWTVLPEGDHVVKLSRLPSGQSQLQVRATDAFGHWSEPNTVITLMRLPKWYEQGWLWTLLALMMLAAAAFFVVKRKTSKEEASQALSEETAPQLSVADQTFVDKATAAVSEHIMDSEYSVDALANDLCMSRANLHRKMRAITGQTPTDFIRNQRLERAALLLKTTSYNMNEIAYMVGFSYASYFSKCFKEKYGVLPKDY